MDLKKKIFAEVDKICPKHTILATNTSCLSIINMAMITSRPDKVLGLHFFNPVSVMTIVEIVKTIATSDETLETGKTFGKSLGKNIIIDPFDEANLNPNSYNLTLHNELMTYEEVVLDMAKPNRVRRITIPPEGLVLGPNQLYLGRTAERTETHELVPMIEGRSSVGRRQAGQLPRRLRGSEQGWAKQI